jgi:hypothetical protein
MRNYYIKIHTLLIVFSVIMFFMGNINRTDLLLTLILLQLTYNNNRNEN